MVNFPDLFFSQVIVCDIYKSQKRYKQQKRKKPESFLSNELTSQYTLGCAANMAFPPLVT